MKGIIFDIQKFCVNDGPGIRTTVFLKGCSLKCVWCHNPESQKPIPEIMFCSDKCTGCGRCKGITYADNDFICFNNAKKICGKYVTADYIIDEVLKDKIFYAKSGGGITLSGGEPFYQFGFLIEILKKAKENGLHTAVETCGFTSQDNIRFASKYTDLFLYDCKEKNTKMHKVFTGRKNEIIINNLKLLNSLNKQIILRCPIVPGYNDRQDHFRGICNIANSLENIIRVEIEPYNSLGENKYSSLGKKCKKIKAPDEAQKNYWLNENSACCQKEVVFA